MTDSQFDFTKTGTQTIGDVTVQVHDPLVQPFIDSRFYGESQDGGELILTAACGTRTVSVHVEGERRMETLAGMARSGASYREAFPEGYSQLEAAFEEPDESGYRELNNNWFAFSITEDGQQVIEAEDIEPYEDYDSAALYAIDLARNGIEE